MIPERGKSKICRRHFQFKCKGQKQLENQEELAVTTPSDTKLSLISGNVSLSCWPGLQLIA